MQLIQELRTRSGCSHDGALTRGSGLCSSEEFQPGRSCSVDMAGVSLTHHSPRPSLLPGLGVHEQIYDKASLRGYLRTVPMICRIWDPPSAPLSKSQLQLRHQWRPPVVAIHGKALSRQPMRRLDWSWLVTGREIWKMTLTTLVILVNFSKTWMGRGL